MPANTGRSRILTCVVLTLRYTCRALLPSLISQIAQTEQQRNSPATVQGSRYYNELVVFDLSSEDVKISDANDGSQIQRIFFFEEHVPFLSLISSIVFLEYPATKKKASRHSHRHTLLNIMDANCRQTKIGQRACDTAQWRPFRTTAYKYRQKRSTLHPSTCSS